MTLPQEIIFHIPRFLDIADCINFCLCNKYIFHLLSTSIPKLLEETTLWDDYRICKTVYPNISNIIPSFKSFSNFFVWAMNEISIYYKDVIPRMYVAYYPKNEVNVFNIYWIPIEEKQLKDINLYNKKELEYKYIIGYLDKVAQKKKDQLSLLQFKSLENIIKVYRSWINGERNTDCKKRKFENVKKNKFVGKRNKIC